MRMRDITKMLFGAGVVYVAVAACSGAEHTAGAGGMCGHGAGGGDSGITNPVPSACADPVSGSRLKAKYRVAEDGSKEHVHDSWYDSMRDEDCSFRTASDGKERCLPAVGGTTGYFIDGTCSMSPVVELDKSPPCAPPKYASLVTVGCGSSSSTIAPVGAQIMPAALYILTPKGCMGFGAPSFDKVYYQVGAEIPPASFVAATQQHD